MTIYTDRIVLVFPIAAKNRLAAASLQTLEITESGGEVEKLVPLDPALVGDYADGFNLGFETEKAALTATIAETQADLATATSQLESANAQKAQLESDHAAATSQLESANAQKASLESQVSSLENEKAATASSLAALQSQVTALTSDNTSIATLQALADRLESQLTEALALVEEYRPFSPNVIRSEAFFDRISKNELLALAVLASTDANAKGILDLLSAYKTNAWQVLLDDAQVVGAMAYLTGLGVLTSGRAGQITAEASKDEAYLAP